MLFILVDHATFGLGINPLTKCSPKETLWWEAMKGQSQIVAFTVMTVAARADLTVEGQSQVVLFTVMTIAASAQLTLQTLKKRNMHMK